MNINPPKEYFINAQNHSHAVNLNRHQFDTEVFIFQMADERMWNCILETFEQGHETLERLQKITSQVSFVVVKYRDLMARSCRFLPKADQYPENGQGRITLSEVLTPLFGYQGEAVAYFQEHSYQDNKDFQPHKDVTDHDDMGNDTQEDCKSDIDVDGTEGSQDNPAELQPLLSEIKAEPNNLSPVASNGKDYPGIDNRSSKLTVPDMSDDIDFSSREFDADPLIKAKRSKRKKPKPEAEIVQRPLRKSKAKSMEKLKALKDAALQEKKKYSEPIPRVYKPTYPVDEETFNMICALPKKATLPECAQCHRKDAHLNKDKFESKSSVRGI